MRITSDLWVSALTRRVFAEGGFAAIVRRGATEAGAIFVITQDRLGTSTLFGLAVTGEPSEEVYAKMREIGLVE